MKAPVQQEDGGSKPTSSLQFSLTTLEDVSGFIKAHHYSHTHPGGADFAFAARMEGMLVGACLFGFMAGNPKGSCVLKGYDNPRDYRELMRLVLYDDVPKNSESQFIGWCLRWLKNNTDIVAAISFADPKHGHNGTIYRASNWLYTGLQNPDRPRLIIEGKEMHPRQAVDTFGTSAVEELRKKGISVVLEEREPKHRYIFVLRHDLTPLLKLEIKPFPKKETS